MKKGNSSFISIIKKISAMILVFAIIVAFSAPMNVEAKVKNKALKPIKNPTFTVDYANKVSTTVKKGSYRFTIKKKGFAHGAFVKFTAPKSKTYTATVSDLRASDGRYANGFFYITKQDARFKSNLDWKKTYWFASKNEDRYKTKVSGKSDIAAGETVYLYFSSMGASAKQVSFNVTIK